MSFLQIIPIAALFGLLAFVVHHARREDYSLKIHWMWPAVLSGLFLVFSLIAVAQEGLLGFWPNHSQSLWGNQVWIDLLFGFGLAWLFLVPRAKVAGMNVWIWFVALLCTGCIGLLAMTARLFYLEQNRTVSDAATLA